MKRAVLVACACVWVSVLCQATAISELDCPSVLLAGIPVDCTVNLLWRAAQTHENVTHTQLIITANQDNLSFLVKNVTVQLVSDDGFSATSITVKGVELADSGHAKLTLALDTGGVSSMDVNVIPGFLCLLPTICTVTLALITKETLSALFAGVLTGGFLLNYFNPISAFLRSMDTYIVAALSQSDHCKVITFTFFLGGCVGVIMKSGGTHAFVAFLQRFASTSYRAQLLVFAVCGCFFFDDYANVVVVGTTMKPLISSLGVSREKFSFIVDSTSAPICSTSPISSWIGFELGMIAASFKAIGNTADPYLTFIKTIPLRFYPLCLLVLMPTLLISSRDFGPMAAFESSLPQQSTASAASSSTCARLPCMRRKEKSEREPLTGGEASPDAHAASEPVDPSLQPIEGKPRRVINATIPLAVLFSVIVSGLLVDGSFNLTAAKEAAIASGDASLDVSQYDPSLPTLLSYARSYEALMWGSGAASLTAILLIVAQRILTFKQAVEAWVAGAGTMLPAILILVFAWALGDVFERLHVSSFVIVLFGQGMDGRLLPAMTFILAGVMAFALGSSWGVMVVFFPIVIPLADSLSPGNEDVLLCSISAILAGSVFGDHCSPLSDTTVLSSLSTGCNHINHVKTQLPYAVFAATIAVIFGYLPVSFGGYSAGVAILLFIIIIVAFVLLIGRRPTDTHSRAHALYLRFFPPPEDIHLTEFDDGDL